VRTYGEKGMSTVEVLLGFVDSGDYLHEQPQHR
jgi:hypothetical protein